MTHLFQDLTIIPKERDIVFTPDAIARAIIQRFQPSGRVLDPCRGDGAFARHIPDCLWCELREGKDFFEWREPVDWIVGNPPYSVLNRWLDHTFRLADNAVYLVPVAKVFGSLRRLRQIRHYGGIAEIWAPWTGRDIGFEFGWAIGAVHFVKNYSGPITLAIDGWHAPHADLFSGMEDETDVR